MSATSSSLAQLPLTIENGIALLRIDRESKLNALDTGLVEALADRCREIERRADVHVVLLTGTGKAFCSGGDIADWSASGATAFGRHWLREGHEAFDRLARLRQPLIAVLNGHTLGGGLELAACADYRIAESPVKIGQPETGLGIIAGWSGTQRAVRRFGAQTVRRMALFGEIFSAEQALGLGIVDRVVERGEGLAAGRELARSLLGRGRRASELTKMLINAAEGEERERVLESIAGALAAESPELQVGIGAFNERRPPDFDKE